MPHAVLKIMLSCRPSTCPFNGAPSRSCARSTPSRSMRVLHRIAPRSRICLQFGAQECAALGSSTRAGDRGDADYHTGRARRILRREPRGLHVDLFMAAAPDDRGSTPHNWWESKDGDSEVHHEARQAARRNVPTCDSHEIKRIFDMLVAGLGLTVLAPVLRGGHVACRPTAIAQGSLTTRAGLLHRIKVRLGPLAHTVSARHRRWRRLLASLTLDPDALPKPVEPPQASDFIICGCSLIGTRSAVVH